MLPLSNQLSNTSVTRRSTPLPRVDGMVISSTLTNINTNKIICDRIWEKGPYRAFKKNRVITTVGKSRL